MTTHHAPEHDDAATNRIHIPRQAGGQTPPPWNPQQQAPAPQPPKRRRRWPWVLAGLFLLIVIVASTSNGGGNTTTSTTGTASAPSAAAPAAAAPSVAAAAPTSAAASGYGKETGAYGDKLTAGGLTLTVTAPKASTQAYLGTQVCSTVTYQNAGDSTETFNPFDWKFRTADGVEASASIPFNAKNPLRSGNLAPGGKVSGQVCGDDSITKASAVVYSPGFGIMHQLTWQ